MYHHHQHRPAPVNQGDLAGLSQNTSGPAPEHNLPGPDSPVPQPFPRHGSLRWWFAAGGAAAPAAPGIAWLAGGHRDTIPLLATAVVLLVVALILNAVTAMYRARQETLRREIDQRGTDLLAAALARCIDSTHATPRPQAGIETAADAAEARIAAARALAGLAPAVVAMLAHHDARSAGLRQPEPRR